MILAPSRITGKPDELFEHPLESYRIQIHAISISTNLRDSVANQITVKEADGQ